MTLRRVELSSDGAVHRAVINGIDVSMGLRGAELSLQSGRLPELTVDPLVVEVPTVELEQAQVVVTDNAAEALIALGWTPPADQ